MADNFKTSDSNLLKTSKPKQLIIKKKKKNKSSAKRKSEKHFKRKRLIHSAYRKKSLKMNYNRLPEVTSSADRCHSYEEMNQIAFWKARAISLEFENKMLYKHIKQMYTNTITQNQQLIQNGEYVHEDYTMKDMNIEQSDNEGSNVITQKKKNVVVSKKMRRYEEHLPPDELNKKIAKEEEMKKLYGLGWNIIRGTETAVDLMYNNHITRKKSAYWPVIPFKM